VAVFMEISFVGAVRRLWGLAVSLRASGRP
jgi:hypothetical protein